MKRVFFLFLLLLCTACGSGKKSLKVAATPVPHAEMLAEIKSDLKERGVDLEIIEVDDYQLPNRLLVEGQVDANFFQHRPFLECVNKEYGDQLIVLSEIHYEPLGIYSDKIQSLEELKAGSVVAIPSDPSNEARALFLLKSLKLIELKPKSLPTILDITENTKGIKLKEIDSPMLPRILPDVEIAVIPANFALQAHLKNGIAFEGDVKYPNVLVIRKGEEGREDLRQLDEALKSDKMKAFLKKKYHGVVVPITN